MISCAFTFALFVVEQKLRVDVEASRMLEVSSQLIGLQKIHQGIGIRLPRDTRIVTLL